MQSSIKKEQLSYLTKDNDSIGCKIWLTMAALSIAVNTKREQK
jgi:hypothetical protein